MIFDITKDIRIYKLNKLSSINIDGDCDCELTKNIDKHLEYLSNAKLSNLGSSGTNYLLYFNNSDVIEIVFNRKGEVGLHIYDKNLRKDRESILPIIIALYIKLEHILNIGNLISIHIGDLVKTKTGSVHQYVNDDLYKLENIL